MRTFFVLLLLLLVVAVGTAAYFYQDLLAFSERSLHTGADQVSLQVKPGTTIRTLARQLAAQGLLDRHPLYLEILARQRRQAHRIKAGEYLLPAGTTPSQLLDLLVSGRVTQYALTLVEGWTFDEVMAAVRADPVLIQTLDDIDNEEIMARLGQQGVHPEGRFFPDTYHFPRQTTDQQFLARAQRAMDRELEQQWADRTPDLPLENPQQALILASIVEKETGMASERPQIAGVFIRRLRRGMKLQTDPTVIYGLGEAFDGNLRRRDLRQDTPYNTYTRTGLPPTPIAMPGADAIRAVLHPADGDALYFVARGDGSHQFSATLVDHNRAVRKFQLKQ